jgi:asparaginyl-tRNA synthetase
MFGPYKAKKISGKKVIEYQGNKIDKPISNINSVKFTKKILESRLDDIVKKEHFYHLHEIDNSIFFASVEYFKKIGADWCNLPLTTKMISSPGEVYSSKILDYTTDTLPINIEWFGSKDRIYLSESSQFYLELRLLIDKVDKVFSIYNSFRKEPADFCHLSEFQHVEFEGKMGLGEVTKVYLGLLKHIVNYLLKHNKNNLGYFLTDKEIQNLEETFLSKNIVTISFKEALSMLYNDTKDRCYLEFSMKNFGAWEEVRLTELFGKHVIVTDYPMMEIPFYHNIKKTDENGVLLAENADMILYGYREVIGSGKRISDPKVLSLKAKQFNLPLEDYAPYLRTRDYKNYKETSGFGMGWQRLTHWILKLPVIWDAEHIPRGHYEPKP